MTLSPFREDIHAASPRDVPMPYGYEDVPTETEAWYPSGPGAAPRMPWDVATESDDATLRASTEAYGAEPDSLTFYGQGYELGAPSEQHEDGPEDSIKELLAKGDWSAAVTVAVIHGERDKYKLTDMLFFARHPELDGKKIPPGDKYKDLRAEWNGIYATLVLPPLGPVSPSTVGPTAVPNEQKSLENLIEDISESEKQIITAWSGALTQFQVVMNAHSDSEGVEDFVGALMKHVGDELISKIDDHVPGVSFAKDVVEGVNEEYERAREARSSAQLRDFLVRFTGDLTTAMNNHARAKADFKQMVETAYARASTDEKKQYHQALAAHMNSLDRDWANVNNVFLLISQEWIRNTMYEKSPGVVVGGITRKPAFVVVSVNKDYTLRSAHLWCDGGQKIAEQLLKNAFGHGLRPHTWPVPRRILCFADSGSSGLGYRAFINLASDGRWVKGSAGEDWDTGARVLAHFRQGGLEATTKVTGE
jgi:hypothetical protein